MYLRVSSCKQCCKVWSAYVLGKALLYGRLTAHYASAGFHSAYSYMHIKYFFKRK